MPTYQYACTECSEPLEAVQKFSDPALTVCPVCGGRLRKVFSAVGIVFKGSGFYRTDNRGSSSEASTAPSNGSAEKAESKTEKSEKTESKKEAKTETSSSSSSSSNTSSEKVA